MMLRDCTEPPRAALGRPSPPGHTRKTSQLSLPTVGKAFSTRYQPKTLKGQESRARGDLGQKAGFSPSITVALGISLGSPGLKENQCLKKASLKIHTGAF